MLAQSHLESPPRSRASTREWECCTSLRGVPQSGRVTKSIQNKFDGKLEGAHSAQKQPSKMSLDGGSSKGNYLSSEARFRCHLEPTGSSHRLGVWMEMDGFADVTSPMQFIASTDGIGNLG